MYGRTISGKPLGYPHAPATAIHELKSFPPPRNYQLTSSDSEPCYRTEVAACIKYMTNRNWLSFVNGHTSSPYDCLKSDETIRGWIREYQKEAEMVIGQMVVDYGMSGDGDERVLTALRRWRQVVELCERGLKYLKM